MARTSTADTRFVDSLARIHHAASDAIASERTARIEVEERFGETVVAAHKSTSARDIKQRAAQISELAHSVNPLRLSADNAPPAQTTLTSRKTPRTGRSAVSAVPVSRSRTSSTSRSPTSQEPQVAARSSRDPLVGSSPPFKGGGRALNSSRAPPPTKTYMGSTWAWERHLASSEPVPLTSQVQHACAELSPPFFYTSSLLPSTVHP
jgi:hypothetical protein